MWDDGLRLVFLLPVAMRPNREQLDFEEIRTEIKLGIGDFQQSILGLVAVYVYKLLVRSILSRNTARDGVMESTTIAIEDLFVAHI